MKLVVQIPCLNEEGTLPLVLQSIPRRIAGIDEIVVLVIDDGSTDRTVEVARSLGVTHFVRHARTQGLGRSFQDGVNYALSIGADIVVNTDGDNQYPQQRIADLVQPIVRRHRRHRDRRPAGPPGRALLAFQGRAAAARQRGREQGRRHHAPDAASGFRAYSRESLMRLNTVTRFSYCMESIIQAGNKRLKIDSVPVVTNPKTRESRLFSSTRQHVFKSAAAIVRAYIMYKPYLIFGWSAIVFAVLGLLAVRPVRRAGRAGRAGSRPRAVAAGRCRAADPVVPERDARHHLRPDPDQPDPDRGHARAHEPMRFGPATAVETEPPWQKAVPF